MLPRLFPEWHPQDAIQLTWPSAGSDWEPLIERIEASLEALVVAITRYQPVLIIVADTQTCERLDSRFSRLGIHPKQWHLIEAPSNDTWTRDHGPIAIERDGQIVLLDYRFTGWGGKFAAERDDALTETLSGIGIYAALREAREMVLEGGAIDGDGEGTLLLTEACLLNPNRNPHLSREDIEAAFRDDMGIERCLWMTQGYLEGDDTDSHVDTLARFCDAETIAYVRCEDPDDPHFSALTQMENELKAFKRADGEPYRLIPLPLPRACYDADDGHRLPATYANFLIINGAVLVPTYADAADGVALTALASAFPGRDIIPIDCRTVIRQHGSLHCLTMQLPRGAFFTASADGADDNIGNDNAANHKE
ncbi:agmatine/peptidylarginine deiminase [Chromohalobacter sarecensis]|uniref:Agmatine/peptidylarginine deiminase n=1 Tax=Chromohalobacter sarecensis TaxID=245294 RepID=A0ABV9D442_9GAMM|nr:agmatine deiminase family protein [Chromohalobacter sarecensis]MCK0714333.1 agmatine deiminase family protein [Chromohalobacter sarecensis]